MLRVFENKFLGSIFELKGMGIIASWKKLDEKLHNLYSS
jgi:hypothetical protein